NGEKLDKAFANLDFMVAIDYFVTETSRHANIILPPVSPLERDHYDVTFNNFAVHNVAKYSPALFAKKKSAKHDWQIYLELAKRLDKKAPLTTKIERRLVKTLRPKFLLDQGLRIGLYAVMILNILKKKQNRLNLV